MAIENLEINQTFNCGVVERHGKHYVNVKNVRSKVHFEDYFSKLISDKGIPIVYDTINRLINANRRLIFLENERHFVKVISEVTHAILTPIFKEIAIQDFFQEKCE